MKLTTGIVFLTMAAGTALGQNPTVINNTKVTLQAAQPSGSPAPKAGAPAPRISAKAAPKAKPAAAHQKSQPKQQIAVENQKKPAEAKSDAPTQVNMTSRRDPFVSPVVNRSMIGSGCSTGKRCLAIDQINLKGVVKADSGMIAVVVNSLNKAYFLRENDPVFNGFVVKITGDSIIFKESVQDRLGKPFMREVTKKITTSAV
jgi:Tfp pilus assembly protein PilP